MATRELSETLRSLKKRLMSTEVKAEKDGYITHIDAEGCGFASAMLGAGRETRESEIDYTAGIILHKKTGEKVEKGDVLAALYTSKEELFEAACRKV